MRDIIKEIVEETIQKVIEQGIQQGQFEQAVQMANKMLAKGFSVRDIEELTGLSKQEVEVLKQPDP